MILAGTEQLHDRIGQISARNRELENALRTLQEQVSDQPHPLLMNILRINTIQGSLSTPSTSSSNKSSSTSQISPTTHPPDPTEAKLDDEQNVIDAFGVRFVSWSSAGSDAPRIAIGTLVVGRCGDSGFFGKTARADLLSQVCLYSTYLQTFNEPHCQAPNKTKRIPHSLSRISNKMMEAAFPDPEIHDDALLGELLNLLPSKTEAHHLCDVYFEYGRFLWASTSVFMWIHSNLYPGTRPSPKRNSLTRHYQSSIEPSTSFISTPLTGPHQMDFFQTG
jgi:hypothetical protein